MTAVCPICKAPQDQGLACHSCCSRLERDLGDVASIVADLEVSMSKQDRLGTSSGAAGLARERMPIGVGAMQAGDNLANVLTTWARDVAEVGFLAKHSTSPTRAAARILLNHVPEIRRHPAVNELVDQITDAIHQARRAVDRPAESVYLGQCMYEQDIEGGSTVTCYEEIYASPSASSVTCKVCKVTHPVRERREWLMKQAEDRLFTVREAAQMVGNVGGKSITEDRIRGYLRRGRIVFHSANLIRLGDLLAIVINDTEKAA